MASLAGAAPFSRASSLLSALPASPRAVASASPSGASGPAARGRRPTRGLRAPPPPAPPPEIACSHCGRHVDDVLVLACGHNLCLVCGAASAGAAGERARRRRERRAAGAETDEESDAASSADLFSARRSGANLRMSDGLACPLCDVCTRLAPETLQALGRAPPDEARGSHGRRRRGGGFAEAAAEPARLCGLCEAREASVFCRGCACTYCDSCAVRVHERNSRLAAHKFRLIARAPGLLLPLGGPAARRAKLREDAGHVRTFEDGSECGGGASSASSLAFSSPRSLASALLRGAVCARPHYGGGAGAAEGGSEKASGGTAASARESVHSSAIAETGGAERARLFCTLLKRLGKGGNIADMLQLCSISNLECEVHPGEPVRFFCMTCMVVPCLCAQCVMGCDHARHALLQIPRAWEEVASRYLHDEFTSTLFRAKADVDALRQALRERRFEWGRSLYEDRQLAAGTGTRLKEEMQEKEHQLRVALTAFTSKFTYECEAFRKITGEKIAQAQQLLQQIRDFRNASDSVLLTFFRDHREVIEKHIAREDPAELEHLPHSRQSILDHATQVTDEICELARELRDNLRNCEGRRREEEEPAEPADDAQQTLESLLRPRASKEGQSLALVAPLGTRVDATDAGGEEDAEATQGQEAGKGEEDENSDEAEDEEEGEEHEDSE
ncbi:B-box zinc finger domain-containing protein [Besnoitia besnoiti]|uniref:B-box zinc finger domain-containing protein n=1 Tax=Besnoitia besnoiti TaxID=94643 RepID=A0A2A9M3N8_BESBE|nr:B-box zinc finger domain-containing protein [Besnoitia besnoiti]PFH32575.1 B-box zinc finger domain-containing protein [Besnoitia besnoiti]